MPALISHIIPQAAYERVRDQIGAILATELDNQATLESEDAPDVWVERWIPFDKIEVPTVNVVLSSGTLEQQHLGHSTGTYTYLIECHTSAVSTDTEEADQLAIIKLHKLLRQCRYILEDPQYKTLGFAPPFIMARKGLRIEIGKPDPQDGASNVMGRLTYEVKAPETNQLLEPVLLGGIDTVVKLSLTNKGYLYITNP